MILFPSQNGTTPHHTIQSAAPTIIPALQVIKIKSHSGERRGNGQTDTNTIDCFKPSKLINFNKSILYYS